MHFDRGTQKVITDATIKFSDPSKFNDPYDCSVVVDPISAERFMKKNFDRLSSNKSEKRLPPGKRILEKKRAANKHRQDAERGDFQQLFKADIGVLCLSRKHNQMLMWAHYAKNHEGFVVGFKIPSDVSASAVIEEKAYEYLPSSPVKYRKQRPCLDLTEEPKLNIEKVFLTKSNDWGYEKEERVIDVQRGHGFHRFKRALLNTVYAGARMKEEDLESLKKIVGKTNEEHTSTISLFKMSLSLTSYDLTETKILS